MLRISIPDNIQLPVNTTEGHESQVIQFAKCDENDLVIGAFFGNSSVSESLERSAH
jgi:hypothetical protein